MNTIRTLWTADEATRRKIIFGGALVTLAGIVVIALGVAFDWGWTRLIGAGLISLAGIVLGMAVGFAEPLRTGLLAALDRSRLAIAIIAALIFGLPAVLALAGALVGAASGGHGGSDAAFYGGLLIAILMLVATLAAAFIAVRATRLSHRRIVERQPSEPDEEVS